MNIQLIYWNIWRF